MKKYELALVILTLSSSLFGQLSDPNFFPRSVWLQNTANAQEYSDAGINMYIGLWNQLNQNQLSDLTDAGMYVICAQNAFGLSNVGDTIITAWIHTDEPDNAQWNSTTQTYDPCIAPADVIAEYNIIKSNDPSRPVYLNLGRGVSDINWIGRGTCTGQYEMYIEANNGYLAGTDIVSFDIYPVNNVDQLTSENLWYVSKGVDSLLTWSSNPKPTWVWIETTKINDNSNRAPTPAEVKSEVWLAIIHGAKGIGYFCHSWTPSFDDAALLHDPVMIDSVAVINQMIDDLAPILNSPSTTNFTSVNSSNPIIPIDFMTKFYGGEDYIFAISAQEGQTVGSFSVPVGSIIEVVGENRFLNESAGQFTDAFSNYGMHIYKISSGTTSYNLPKVQEVALFPNPTSGIIIAPISLNNTKYEIISTDGQTRQKGVVGFNKIDLANLNAGMYFIRFFDPNRGYQYVSKVLKKN